MIKLSVIGNLGKDCVVNQVNGKSVINFSVAHTEKFKDQSGQQKDKTIWVECAYWTDRTGIAQYLVKGQQVYVEGQPDIKTYTDKQNRQVPYMVLRVGNITLVGGTKGGEDKYSSVNQQTQRGNYVATAGANDITEPLDDLPF